MPRTWNHSLPHSRASIWKQILLHFIAVTCAEGIGVTHRVCYCLSKTPCEPEMEHRKLTQAKRWLVHLADKEKMNKGPKSPQMLTARAVTRHKASLVCILGYQKGYFINKLCIHHDLWVHFKRYVSLIWQYSSIKIEAKNHFVILSNSGKSHTIHI